MEFLSLKEAAQAGLILHLSKCHIVGNNMSQLKLCSPADLELQCFKENIEFCKRYVHSVHLLVTVQSL